MIIEMSENEGLEVLFQHVQFEVTGVCNMKCRHCRAWDEPKQAMRIDVLKNVLDFVESESEGGFGVTISGGEPFVRMDLPEIIKMTASTSAKLVVITTNGSLCEKQRLADILKVKGEKEVVIQVSVDSADASDHDSFRGYADAHEKALSTLAIARDLGFATTIRATIRAGETIGMERLVILARKLKVKGISFGTVVPFGRATGNELGMLPNEKRKFLLEVTRLKRIYGGKFMVETEDPLKSALGCDDVWKLGDIDPDDDLSFGGCTAGITTFNVTSDGFITPCAVIPCKILNATGKTPDNIREEYASSPIIKELLSRSFSGKCGSCRLKRVCGGCRALPYATHGKLMGEDYTCWR